ncbi:MAG: type IIL restriction-modification enzyme MmeI [Beijerinckiaceae bacterium]|jgi:SAM-dependent methyltransferase
MEVDAFIACWTAREGGTERANYQMFLSDLCDVLGVARPDPDGTGRDDKDYVFERAVRPRDGDLFSVPKRIDLYKKGAFILEAKQSRLPGKKNAIPGQVILPAREPEYLGRRGIARGWDVMMQNARKQAEGYVFLLETSHPAPPFIMTCDVGHCFEIFADFTGTGRAYSQFPGRQGFRIYLEDLRKPEIRERLSRIWSNPYSLDPARDAARVTAEIAKRLAQVSKSLEARGFNAEEVAHFLMRCLFTMFASDVELLPRDCFKALLRRSVEDPIHFPHRLKTLWEQIDRGESFSHVIDAPVRQFSGALFKSTFVFPLGREEISELLAAANRRWTEVDPAIFGTLLEQALEPAERKKLGAHFTPRVYVQRLVEATVMEPLRADWQMALTKAEQAKEDGDEKGAVTIVRAFHRHLCATRVLDPACGTGNFLYVALELMKKLEGEVLEALAELGEPENMGLERETVDPAQFLGLELNPRAAAIAELVVWIGYLQQHYKTRSGHPCEPILKVFDNINFGKRSGYDAVLTWDGFPAVPGAGVKLAKVYPNAKTPQWPEAEFIVGNQPFIPNREMRGLLSDGYVDCLRRLYREFTHPADFVLFFWIQATSAAPTVRRIGFVSTSRIRMKLNNIVLRNALGTQWHIRFAIPDHAWPSSHESARIRVAFITVARHKGPSTLVLAPDHEVIGGGLMRGLPGYVRVSTDMIAPDLTQGPDDTILIRLRSNEGLCHTGVKPYARRLHIDAAMRDKLFPDEVSRARHVPAIMNGYDIGQSWRGLYVIDVNELEQDDLRRRFPAAYQYILRYVKPERALDRNPRLRREFWRFESNRMQMRRAMEPLSRYIATMENSAQRQFVFLPTNVIPDQKLRVIVDDDAYTLAVLSSRHHTVFSITGGGRVGRYNTPVYNTDCFMRFPFPHASPALAGKLRALGEELDATRKGVLATHPGMTLTRLYAVLDKVKAGAVLESHDREVKARGLVLILQELHEDIDRLVAEAYGWPASLTDEQILDRLAALNAQRAVEEAAGHVRWLRPSYQIPRFATGTAAKSGGRDLDDTVVALAKGMPAFPTDRYEQPLAVEALLLAGGDAKNAAELARAFKRGGKRIEARVAQVLTTLARYGRVAALDGGRYAARKAA